MLCVRYLIYFLNYISANSMCNGAEKQENICNLARITDIRHKCSGDSCGSNEFVLSHSNSENTKPKLQAPITQNSSVTKLDIGKFDKPEKIWRIMKKENKKLQRFKHKTMGEAQTTLPEPKAFLKKKTNSRLRQTPQRANKGRCKCIACQGDRKRGNPVPKAEVLSKTQPTKLRNYCNENVSNISHMPTLQRSPRMVVTRNGKTCQSNAAGIQLQYVNKKDYGRVPNYIQAIKTLKIKAHERADEIEAEDCQQKEAVHQTSLACLDQRIEDLKSLWTKKNKEFLLLPVVTDILARVRRRHNLEQELFDIEKQICVHERQRKLQTQQEII